MASRNVKVAGVKCKGRKFRDLYGPDSEGPARYNPRA